MSEAITEKTLHLHLVSDSTGETVSSVARAASAQFEGLDVVEHHWSLVRTDIQMQRVLEHIRSEPGMVLYTMVDEKLRTMLKRTCSKLKVPCVPVLSRIVSEISSFMGVENTAQPGRQHALDDDYFERMEAINFTLAHDDGQAHWNLEEADIVLVGASRTSKTPTCIYLAYRGYKAGNIPFVMDVPMPDVLDKLKNVFVVGLSIDPEQLVHIRRSRLLALNERPRTNYVEEDKVKEEVLASRKLFSKYRWPMIDVSRRSVEETAATIIQMYQEWKG